MHLKEYDAIMKNMRTTLFWGADESLGISLTEVHEGTQLLT